jgi:type II secretory pathway component PulF
MTQSADPVQPTIDPPLMRLIELSKIAPSLPQGLRAAAEEFPGRRMRRAMVRLADTVEAGGVPSGVSRDALESMIAAAAIDANQSDALAGAPVSIAPQLAAWVDQTVARNSLTRRVLANLWIAIALLMVGGLANWLVVAMVQWPMIELIEEFELQVPTAMTILFAVSPWVGPLVCGVSIVWASVMLMYQFAPTRRWVEPLVYALPLAGTSLRRLQLAAMCDGISRSLAAGLTYPDAFRSAASTVDSSLLRGWMRDAAIAVSRGSSLIDAVARIPISGEIIPAVVGPVGPDPDRPWIGWGIAADYFQSAAIRGVGTTAILIPVFSLIAAMLGWLGLASAFTPIIQLMSVLGGL